MAVNLDTLNPKQLSDLIVRAEQRKNALIEERAVKVRDKLIAAAKAEGYTIEQLFGSGKKRKQRQLRRSSATPQRLTKHGRGVAVSRAGISPQSRPVRRKRIF